MRELKIYNSMQRKKVVFEPLDKNHIRIYACGPTVYDYAHIGNARMAVVFDSLVRLLRSVYTNVTYVSNITDIDDKIIDRSIRDKVSIKEVSNKFAKIYNKDMHMLNVLAPDFQPKATDYVEKMIKDIKILIDKKYAYYSEKHVMFDVSSYPKYGSLSSRNKEDQIDGSRVQIAQYKKNPRDFILWKPSKNNEPGWDSPWGKGRPGWHTECFSMSKQILKVPFDIHGGGLDLKFPHHENEIAQSCCFHDSPENENSYAKYWMHNGFVTVNSEKMSKSIGNIKLVKDYLHLYDGEVIRLALLSAHYRSPLNWSESVIIQSKSILKKYYKILKVYDDVEIDNKEESELGNFIKEALLDDLNIAKASNILDSTIKDIDKKNIKEIKIIKKIILDTGKIIGVFLKDPKKWGTKEVEGDSLENINKLISERNSARENKDFQLADEIRKKLYNIGIEIKDDKKGTQWKKF
jgi:cysteinyl-tRNA synthetase